MTRHAVRIHKRRTRHGHSLHNGIAEEKQSLCRFLNRFKHRTVREFELAEKAFRQMRRKNLNRMKRAVRSNLQNAVCAGEFRFASIAEDIEFIERACHASVAERQTHKRRIGSEHNPHAARTPHPDFNVFVPGEALHDCGRKPLKFESVFRFLRAHGAAQIFHRKFFPHKFSEVFLKI